jgi:hypothetical protein
VKLLHKESGEKKETAEVNAIGLHDFTALHFAAESGSFEACTVIIQLAKNVNVNSRTF